MAPETPRNEQPKKPNQGGLGNIDEERGHPGKGEPGKGVRPEDDATRPDNERRDSGSTNDAAS